MTDCQHKWLAVKSHEAPHHELSRWFRCALCRAYGWARKSAMLRRGDGRAPVIAIFRCSVPACRLPATLWMGYRGATQHNEWRCNRHQEPLNGG